MKKILLMFIMLMNVFTQPTFASKDAKSEDLLLRSKHSKSHAERLHSSYPWEYIHNNKKTFRFVVMNFYTDLFDPSKVSDISQAIESYVSKYVYPSWRSKVSIEFFTPPSQLEIANAGLNDGQFINALPLPGTFIPIILTNDFSSNIPSNFATAVHGNVSGSPTTGYNASLYIDNDSYTLTGPVPFGTPFIVIPAGSFDTSNGIMGQMQANSLSGEGPTDFYQVLSLVMSQEIISLLIDPTAALYIGSGNPLGNPEGGPLPDGTSGVTTQQIFYLRDATAPFLYGNKNIVKHHKWSMGNFALPAYFMPESSAAPYDLLERTSAPLTPYKGTQFVIYQDFEVTNYPAGNLTDLLVGTYVSPLNSPENIYLLPGGSIYDYSGWDQEFLTTIENSQFSQLARINGIQTKSAIKSIEKKVPEVNSSTITNGRNLNSVQFEKAFTRAKKSKTATTSKKLKKPKLLPFQYIDKEGFLTVRFAIINYIPNIILPEVVDQALPVLDKYIKQEYLPYYNVRSSFKNYTILPGDVGLPEFDGTFIPFFLLNIDQFNVDSIGSLVVGGGATNVNNVPNILAGPQITQYLQASADFSVPVLPLANPYLMISAANFPGQVTVTTDQAGLGPFIAIPTGSSQSIPTTFPIVALGADADPLDGCTPLVNNLSGKIGVNVRSGCDSTVYPNNIADAGAIAFLTVFSQAKTFVAPGAEIWGATLGPDGIALSDALATNPNITVTISAPVGSVNDYNALTEILAHETEELCSDSNYATYVMTFNPNVDSAVLFSQYEAADPTESFNVLATKKGHSFGMECFPTPSYFVAYLRNNNYDSAGIIWRALVPESRQQVVFHFKNDYDAPYNGIHWGEVLGPTENGFAQDLFLQDLGNIFDPLSFYPPQTAAVTSPIEDTPLNTIYDALRTLVDVLFL